MSLRAQFAILTLLSVTGVSAALQAKPKWEHVTSKDGITVTMRDVPGRGFPTFRGVATINAYIFDVVAVISDIKRHTEWMEQCTDARLLKQKNEFVYVVYSRTNAPWPVSDRDAVYYSEAKVNPKRYEVKIHFRAVKSPLMGKVGGVVRMEKLRGYFHLRALGLDRTRIDYQVDADPAGMLPKWLAKLATKRLPLHTIRSLRKQVTRTRGWYHKRIKRWKAMYEPKEIKELSRAAAAARSSL